MIDINESCKLIFNSINYYGDHIYGKVLTETVIKHKPKRILEFGSGTGYTTLNLALGCFINGIGNVVTHDIFETADVGHFKIHPRNNFLNHIKLFPELHPFIQSYILDYNDWLSSKSTDFDMIYFDVNNDGDKILEIYQKLKVDENKGKILLFEGGHPLRNNQKYQNVRPIFNELVKSTTKYELIYDSAPGIIQIIL